MRHRLAGITMAMTAAAVSAQGASGVSPPHASPARMTAIVKELTTSPYQGRAPGTPGEDRTIFYLAREYRALGLEPIGPDGSYFQSVPLIRTKLAAGTRVTIDTGGGAMPLDEGQGIYISTVRDTDRIAIAGAPLVFVGYGVSAPERGWDDFKGVDLKGKIAVFLVNDPDFAAAGGEAVAGKFGGRRMTYYGRWTYKYEEAARRGAVGTLIVHESKPASYEWATVKNSNTNAMFDIVRENPKASHAPVEAWIQRDLAVQLFRASGLDFDGAKKAAQSRSFRPMPLNATLSIDLKATSGTIVSHNVVGRVIGSTKPDETLIYSAHWDHLGVGAPDAKGDKIYNGALDNASGTAALIEMGRAFATGPRPQRSVVFLAVTAEEKGLLGSEYYATHPLYPLATTVGAINMDGIQMLGVARNFSILGSAKLGLLDDLIAEGAKVGRTFTPEAHPENGGFFRSDHFTMAKQGVPAISFEAGNDLVDGGTARGEALVAEYTKNRYHQPADEWDPKTDLSGAVQDLDLLYTLGERLANSREWPQWSADSEFRAARDQTASARK